MKSDSLEQLHVAYHCCIVSCWTDWVENADCTMLYISCHQHPVLATTWSLLGSIRSLVHRGPFTLSCHADWNKYVVELIDPHLKSPMINVINEQYYTPTKQFTVSDT